jgi:hypothetical protein
MEKRPNMNRLQEMNKIMKLKIMAQIEEIKETNKVN